MNLTQLSGGRTAWSARVIIGPQVIAARMWYDGRNVNNAKEDAAEVACLRLGVAPPLTQTGQQQQQGHWGAIGP